jgi:hypothetical protein
MKRFSQVIASSVLITGLMAAGCTVSQTEPASGAPLARQITESAHCGLTAPGHLYLSSKDQIHELETLPGRNLSLAPLRAIDFGQEHIVLVSLGRKPTGGYSVTLAGANREGNRLELSVRTLKPAPGAMVTQVLTTPCAVIAVVPGGWDTVHIRQVEGNR